MSKLFFWRKPETPAPAPVAQKPVQASYDAAQSSRHLDTWWAAADNYSADKANSPAVRQALRNRSRYESDNNSIARGIVLTLANDVMGTGPRLQCLTDSKNLNNSIETRWAAWAEAVDLPGKLHVMRQARCTDGEAFALLVNRETVDHAVKLDLQLIEADQVTNGYADLENLTDGVELDGFGNPVAYYIMKSHPGDGLVGFSPDDYLRIPAEQIIHYFRPTRPGQHRGIPELTPALNLFAQLRRYTLAVITAAENAAEMSITVATTAPAAERATTEAGTVDFPRGRMMFLPEGWTANQMKAEQPASTYPEFKRQILTEIARCLNMPYVIASLDASGHNYASGRLDHQTYFKSILVERRHAERNILERVFAAWLAEARIVLGIGATEIAHEWLWPGNEHVDPAKESKAQDMRLRNLSTTYAAEYARQGKDYEEEFRQIARERSLMAELGLTVSDVTPEPDDNEEEQKPNEE